MTLNPAYTDALTIRIHEIDNLHWRKIKSLAQDVGIYGKPPDEYWRHQAEKIALAEFKRDGKTLYKVESVEASVSMPAPMPAVTSTSAPVTSTSVPPTVVSTPDPVTAPETTSVFTTTNINNYYFVGREPAILPGSELPLVTMAGSSDPLESAPILADSLEIQAVTNLSTPDQLTPVTPQMTPSSLIVPVGPAEITRNVLTGGRRLDKRRLNDSFSHSAAVDSKTGYELFVAGRFRVCGRCQQPVRTSVNGALICPIRDQECPRNGE